MKYDVLQIYHGHPYTDTQNSTPIRDFSPTNAEWFYDVLSPYSGNHSA